MSKIIMKGLEHNVLISWQRNELEEFLSTEAGLAMEDIIRERILRNSLRYGMEMCPMAGAIFIQKKEWGPYKFA